MGISLGRDLSRSLSRRKNKFHKAQLDSLLEHMPDHTLGFKGRIFNDRADQSIVKYGKSFYQIRIDDEYRSPTHLLTSNIN